MHDPLRCIVLIGATNSGKTTLARKLAGDGVPVVHCDRLIREAKAQIHRLSFLAVLKKANATALMELETLYEQQQIVVIEGSHLLLRRYHQDLILFLRERNIQCIIVYFDVPLRTLLQRVKRRALRQRRVRHRFEMYLLLVVTFLIFRRNRKRFQSFAFDKIRFASIEEALDGIGCESSLKSP